MSLSARDQQYMARALQLAKRGCYTTLPNPRVGCVITAIDEAGEPTIVGEGWHYRAGDPHAEIYALSAAATQAQGATAYVTLEPCSHTGKTGPCTEALIRAGIARVVYGMQDPNPQVQGRGLARLREAGIRVDGPLLESQVMALNPGFIRRMQGKRPWVRAKLAMSLDGRTAMQNGESQWITGPAARADVQRWRAQSCAVLTGIGSIRHDDSRLTVRATPFISDEYIPKGAERKQPVPLRVVLDTQLNIDPEAALLQEQGEVVVFIGQSYEEAVQTKRQQLCERFSQLSIICVAQTDVGLDLAAVLDCLASVHHCNEVLVEAGACLSGAFWREQLVDELIVYQAPVLLGSKARPLLELSLSAMCEQQRVTVLDQRRVGDDWRMIIQPQTVNE